MASTLGKCRALRKDIAALAQLLSSPLQQSEEHEALKTEVASNSNASSMAVGTLQIRLNRHKSYLLPYLLFRKKLEYWFDFGLESFAVGQIFL